MLRSLKLVGRFCQRCTTIEDTDFFLSVGKIMDQIMANQGPVVQSLVSTNRWLRGIKTYRFPWYLTLVSANHASSNPGHIGPDDHNLSDCFRNK